MNGIIKMYNHQKGYGFIYTSNDEIYFHISDINNKMLQPEIGMQVIFEIKEGKKGNQAHHIELIPINSHSIFVKFDDIRIKASNIKNYGIIDESDAILKRYKSLWDSWVNAQEYEADINSALGKKKLYDKEILDSKAIGILAAPPSAVFEANYIKKCESAKSNVQYFYNKLQELENSQDYLVAQRKDLKCLYVTTYQNDNFKFYQHQSAFNIFEKLAELDRILC